MELKKTMCVYCGNTDVTAKCLACGSRVCGHCAKHMGGRDITNVLCPKCYKHYLNGEVIKSDIRALIVEIVLGVIFAAITFIFLIQGGDSSMLVFCVIAFFAPFMMHHWAEEFSVFSFTWLILVIFTTCTIIIPVILFILEVLNIVSSRKDYNKAEEELIAKRRLGN